MFHRFYMTTMPITCDKMWRKPFFLTKLFVSDKTFCFWWNFLFLTKLYRWYTEEKWMSFPAFVAWWGRNRGQVHLGAADWAPGNWAPCRLGAGHLGAVSSSEEKTMKQAISWMPLSANLLKLESSILPRAKRAANRNNVASEQRI